jgi:hypothetical protein
MVKNPCRVANGLGQRKREGVRVYEVFVWLSLSMLKVGQYSIFSYCDDDEVAKLLLEAIEKKREEGLSLVEISDQYMGVRLWNTLSYKAKAELMEGLIEFLKVKSQCRRRWW